MLKTLFPDELQLGLAQATVAALAALLVVVAGRRRGIHLQKELIIAMVQIVAVGSILLLLLHAPDWTGVLLLVSMIVAAGATSARCAKGMPDAFRIFDVFHRLWRRISDRADEVVGRD